MGEEKTEVMETEELTHLKMRPLVDSVPKTRWKALREKADVALALGTNATE